MCLRLRVVQPLSDDSYLYSVAELAVPTAMKWSDIQEAAKLCEETQSIGTAIVSGDWSRCSAIVKSIRNEFSNCDGVVLRGDRILIPVSLRQEVLQLAHEGHQGIVKTKKRLCLKVWWPGIDRDAEVLCRQCFSCQLVGTNGPSVPITPTKMPSGPWQFCSMDLVGPLPDGRSIVVVIDYFSRLFEFSFLRSTKADKVVSFLEGVFALYGYPEMLRSDNGPQFISQEFQSYLTQCGIKWISTTPLWPQANGEVERANRTILKVLKIAKSEGRDLEKAMVEFSMAYKATPHTATGMTPFSLMFGREMRTKLPMLSSNVSRTVDEARDSDAYYKLKMRESANQGAKESPIQPGDTVLMKRDTKGKLDSVYSPEPYQVDRQGHDLVCSSSGGHVLRRHVSVAKKLQSASQVDSELSIPSFSQPSSEVSVNSNQLGPDLSVNPAPSSPSSKSLRVGMRDRKLPSKFRDFKMN